jgi:hypothetical protein
MTFGAPPEDLYAAYATQIQASASAWAVLFSDSAIWSVVSLLGMFAMLQAHRNRPRAEPQPSGDPEDDEPIDLEAVAAAGQQALNRPWQRAQRPLLEGDASGVLGQRADAAVLAMLEDPLILGESPQTMADLPQDAKADEPLDPAAIAPTLPGDRPLRPWQVRDFTLEPLRVAAEQADDANQLEPSESPEITMDTAAEERPTLH